MKPTLTPAEVATRTGLGSIMRQTTEPLPPATAGQKAPPTAKDLGYYLKTQQPAKPKATPINIQEETFSPSASRHWVKLASAAPQWASPSTAMTQIGESCKICYSAQARLVWAWLEA